MATRYQTQSLQVPLLRTLASFQKSLVYNLVMKKQSAGILLYRKKNSPANILSFPLGHDMGEIFINMPKAQSDARIYKRTYKNQVGYLFIHGLFHLKGYRHNSTMERAEARVRKKFSIIV